MRTRTRWRDGACRCAGVALRQPLHGRDRPTVRAGRATGQTAQMLAGRRAWRPGPLGPRLASRSASARHAGRRAETCRDCGQRLAAGRSALLTSPLIVPPHRTQPETASAHSEPVGGRCSAFSTTHADEPAPVGPLLRRSPALRSTRRQDAEKSGADLGSRHSQGVDNRVDGVTSRPRGGGAPPLRPVARGRPRAAQSEDTVPCRTRAAFSGSFSGSFSPRVVPGPEPHLSREAWRC